MNLEMQAPEWGWYYVAIYFFIAGVSAGAYFIGSLAELLGRDERGSISRTAYDIAFPPLLVTPFLLIADLGQPGRFWHLFFDIKGGGPYINLQSAMSVGSWALVVFGVFSFLSFLDNRVAAGHLRCAPFMNLYNRIPRKLYAVVGSVAGFFVAGYPGVLMNATAVPLWAATDPLLGALFIASSASTGAAAIALYMAWRKMASVDTFGRVEGFDRIAMLVELVIIAAAIIAAGQFAAPLIRGPYALMFWGGTVVLGILLPLGLGWYGRRPEAGISFVMGAPILVLFGGALLRITFVQAVQM